MTSELNHVNLNGDYQFVSITLPQQAFSPQLSRTFLTAITLQSHVYQISVGDRKDM